MRGPLPPATASTSSNITHPDGIEFLSEAPDGTREGMHVPSALRKVRKNPIICQTTPSPNELDAHTTSKSLTVMAHCTIGEEMAERMEKAVGRLQLPWISRIT
jgi:hypothetical protein